MYNGNYFVIDDFSGGLASAIPITQIKPNQADNLDNIVIKPKGKGFRTRLGNSKFNGTVMNSGANVQGLGYYLQEGLSKWLIAVCGDKIFKSDELDGIMDDITGGLTVTAGADNHWDIFTFNDVVYGFGGPKASPDAAFKYDGTGTAVVLTGNPTTPLEGAFAANNRVFGWAGSTIYWTVIGDAEDWSGTGSGNAIIGSLKDNQGITGTQVISTNYMIVFKKNSTHQMVISSAPFPVYSMFPTTGCVGKYASVNADGTVFFIKANKRMYSTNGETIKEYPNVIDDVWEATLDTRLGQIIGFRQKGTDYDWIVWMTTFTGSTNWRAIIWDLKNECWLQCTTGYKMNIATPDTEGNMYLGSYDGFIYKLDQTGVYADASESSNSGQITGYWQTGFFNPDNIDKIVQVRKLRVIADWKASGTITVDYGFDGTQNSTQYTVVQTRVGTALYVDKEKTISGRGNTFEFRISGISTAIDVSIHKIILAGKTYGQKEWRAD